MAGKVLSIEIGGYETRVLEIDYKVKAPKIHQFFSIPTPDYMVADGSVIIDNEFIAAMKKEMKARNIRTRKVIFVLNSVRIASREVLVPVVKENKLHELLITNSAEYFPVDLVQYQLVHHIIEKDVQENRYKLSVLAVPNEMIQSYLALAEALELQVTALDYMGNSITQGMLRFIPEEIKIAVKVDETSALITIIRGNQVALQRNISYGIRDAVEVVMDNPAFGGKKSEKQALELMRSRNCLLEAEVEENLRPLIGNISRIIDYYTSRNQDVAINEIWLIGIGAECMGFDEILSAELNVQIRTLQNLPQHYSLGKNMKNEEFRVAEYIACIAAAIEPLNFNLSTGKGTGALAKIGKGELGYAGVVCGACFLLAIGLVVYSFASMTLQRNRNAGLQSQIDALSEARQVYQTYITTKEEYDSLEQLYGLTEAADDALLAFLTEMEEKMPSEISVSSMTAGTDGVSMNITVSSKKAASKVLQQLRNFETLAEIDTPGITETDNSGITTVSFSVYCTYAEE